MASQTKRSRLSVEAIIGPLASAANLRGAFNLNLALLLDEAGAVFHVPAEGAKEGIEKIVAELGFVVIGAFEFREAMAEGFDETVQLFFKRLKRGVVRH